MSKDLKKGFSEVFPMSGHYSSKVNSMWDEETSENMLEFLNFCRSERLTF